MKIILILFTCCWLVHSRLHRMVLDDELHPYGIDKNVPSYLEYFYLERLVLELIDDEKVKLGGYGLCIKSFDPILPLQMVVRTSYLENSIWREGPVRLIVPNMCSEFLNPSRFWYNVTKLWTNCPPKEGEKWVIDTQIIDILIEKPTSLSNGPWRGYILFSQGLLGTTGKFGMMVQVELIEVI